MVPLFMFKRSLTTAFVLFVSVSFFVLFALLSWGQYHALKSLGINDTMVTIKAVLGGSKSRLEAAFLNDDILALEREVTAIDDLADVSASAVIDAQGVVRLSSSGFSNGEAVKLQLDQIKKNYLSQGHSSSEPILTHNPITDKIIAYLPLVIPTLENQSESRQVGLLYVEWDLTGSNRMVNHTLSKNMTIMAVLVVGGILVLVVGFRKTVVAPLNNLKNKANRIADGTEAISFGVEGVAEFGVLSQSLNRMNLTLNKSLQEVKLSEQRWLFALEGAGDGVQDWNLVTDECYFSDQVKVLLGLPDVTEVGWDEWMNAIQMSDREYVERKIQRHLKGLSEVCRVEYNVDLEGGDRHTILMRGRVVEWLSNGKPSRFVATHTDITVRRLMDDALRSSEEKYRKLFEMAQEGIWLLDSEGNTVLVNGAMAAMLGHLREEMVGSRFSDYVEPGQRHLFADLLSRDDMAALNQVDVEFVSKGGRRVHASLNSAPLYNDDGQNIGIILGVMDITQRKLAAEKIKQQALYDELTNLPNRRMLNELLGQEQARAVRHKHCGALLFLDLDHFKNVNDSLGHPIGDGLLVSIGERLKTVIREEDTLARLGGDEFVVLLPELSKDERKAASLAHSVAVKIQDVLQHSFNVSGHKLNVSCSIGIALYPLDQETIHDIMKHADAAMYRAKEDGRGTIRVFSKVMHEEIEQNLGLQMMLPQALEQEQFSLFFQPQFNHKNQIIGAEVLLRWFEPNLGFVRPDHFIRAAEECGQIIPLGDWVIKKSCEQLRQWQNDGLPSTFNRLAINISPRQFMLEDFAQRVLGFVEQAGLSPSQIELEITEGMLLNRLDLVVEKMQLLHKMGFYMALDDFGTGYSSLSYLSTLPLHKLKIDQAFVRDIDRDKNDRVIVETIISMAQHLDMDVIAEGVEEKHQLDFLQQKGCFQFQGYYFSKPIPADEFYSDWISVQSRSSSV